MMNAVVKVLDIGQKCHSRLPQQSLRQDFLFSAVSNSTWACKMIMKLFQQQLWIKYTDIPIT